MKTNYIKVCDFMFEVQEFVLGHFEGLVDMLSTHKETSVEPTPE